MKTLRIFNYYAQQYTREWQQGVQRQKDEFYDMMYNPKAKGNIMFLICGL